MRVSICRKAHFNAAHRVYNPAWSDEKNQKVFGACSNPHYHGHNYQLEVLLTGEVNPDTGYLYDFKHLDELIQTHVIALLDHKNINLDVAAFAERIPTSEHMVYFVYQQLRPHLNKAYALRVILHETERNRAIYPPYEGSII